MALNINPALNQLTQKAELQDIHLKMEKEKQMLKLKILLNSLMLDLKSASKQEDKDSIKNQILNIIGQDEQGEKAFSQLGEDVNSTATDGILGNNAITPGKKNQMEANTNSIDGYKDLKARKNLMNDLKKEFGIKDDSHRAWLQADEKSDKIKVDGELGTVKDAKSKHYGEEKIKKGGIIEVQSQKYGTVKISVGGDASLNGADETILAVGNQTAANNMQAGLNNINKAGCPACGGAGCPACSGKAATVSQAQAVSAAPQAAQMASVKPALSGMIDQAQDPYNLGDSDIKALIAAIMQIINKK